MRISREPLAEEAQATGFRVDMLEKLVRLLALLEAIRDHPLLGGKLALKGGTALNLFVFNVPRLSVDLDLNYIGAASREAMLEERPRIETTIEAVFHQEGFAVRRIPREYAGGKWSLRFTSVSGRNSRLDVDLNFMYRVPLWPVATMNSHSLGSWQTTGIHVVDLHELAAGKLSALLSRRATRDLFDSRSILKMDNLELQRLRLAFIVYGAMSRKDWRTVSVKDVAVDTAELFNQFVPLLRIGAIGGLEEAQNFGNVLVEECRRGLSTVLPFTDTEFAFLDLLLDRGEIDASILTTDASMQQRIQAQPLLEWKALNVRRHKGLS